MLSSQLSESNPMNPGPSLVKVLHTNSDLEDHCKQGLLLFDLTPNSEWKDLGDVDKWSLSS